MPRAILTQAIVARVWEWSSWIAAITTERVYMHDQLAIGSGCLRSHNVNKEVKHVDPRQLAPELIAARPPDVSATS